RRMGGERRGRIGGGPRCREHLRRLPRHAAHAGHVQEEGALEVRLLLIAATFLFAAAPAHAQLVSRAEDGTVEYLLGAPAGLDTPVEVGRGDTAWTEQLRPAHVVRLTSSGADRNRPVFVPGVQEGGIV